MRPIASHAAMSSVGKHTARESEAPNVVRMGKSAWRAPTPRFWPGSARSVAYCPYLLERISRFQRVGARHGPEPTASARPGALTVDFESEGGLRRGFRGTSTFWLIRVICGVQLLPLALCRKPIAGLLGKSATTLRFFKWPPKRRQGSACQASAVAAHRGPFLPLNASVRQ